LFSMDQITLQLKYQINHRVIYRGSYRVCFRLSHLCGWLWRSNFHGG
jgi:hypothetical protein